MRKLQSHAGLHGKLAAGVVRADNTLKRLRLRSGMQRLQGARQVVQIYLHTGHLQS